MPVINEDFVGRDANAITPVLGLCAHNGVGETALLCRLLPILKSAHKMNVAVIKHADRELDLDQSAKDGCALHKAGASETLLSFNRHWALVGELADGQSEKTLSELIGRLHGERLDLIIVEGFQHEPFPKIELHREKTGRPLMCLKDKNVVALACDTSRQRKMDIPVFSIDDADAMAEFVVSFCEQRAGAVSQNKKGAVTIPVAVAELFDRYSILLIKEKIFAGHDKQRFVLEEKRALHKTIEENGLDDFLSSSLFAELLKCNQRLWDVCDLRRQMERDQVFDKEFVKQARLEYKTNDLRFELKNRINELFDSRIKEVKSYSKLSHHL